VAIRDKDVAIGGGDDVGGFVEMIWSAAGDACCPESHENLSIRGELEDLLALGSVFTRERVGHPDVAFAVDVQAVREYEKTGAHAPDGFSGVAIE
jgi:hypothetical protein